MFMFILGIVLGIGLVLAAQELHLQVLLFKQDRLRMEQDQALRHARSTDQCTCWGGPSSTGEHAYYCSHA